MTWDSDPCWWQVRDPCLPGRPCSPISASILASSVAAGPAATRPRTVVSLQTPAVLPAYRWTLPLPSSSAGLARPWKRHLSSLLSMQSSPPHSRLLQGLQLPPPGRPPHPPNPGQLLRSRVCSSALAYRAVATSPLGTEGSHGSCPFRSILTSSLKPGPRHVQPTR